MWNCYREKEQGYMNVKFCTNVSASRVHQSERMMYATFSSKMLLLFKTPFYCNFIHLLLHSKYPIRPCCKQDYTSSASHCYSVRKRLFECGSLSIQCTPRPYSNLYSF